jgi:membrane-bound metal-dependent hydrolase YbcI (DUF457 family)
MANFKTHITTSTILGIGYGTSAFLLWDIPAQHCLIAAGLCSVAGMLPDLDSDTGVPVRETLCFLSVLVPMLMLPRFEALGMNAEQIVFASALIYVGFRFGVGEIFKRYTKHRGMWHSVPAAAIAGLATYVVCLSPDTEIRFFKSWAVVIGFLSHLVLDEIYSVDLYGRQIRIKKSFGTALKLFGPSRWANVTTYAKLLLLIAIVMGDTRFMNYFGHEAIAFPLKVPDGTREWVGELIPIARESINQLR